MAIHTDFLPQLKRLSLIINKRVTSNYTGDRKAAHAQGAGLIFKDYASYTFGDDFRAIDWRKYAKTEKLYVKRFEEERNITVHVILDASASMGFKTQDTTKFEYGSMIGIGFAYLALRNNERFVLSTFADRLEFFKPQKGMAQLASITAFLNEKKPKGNTHFAGSLATYKKLVRSRSVVIIISDFLYPIEELEDVLGRFRSNKVVLVQVLDPVEASLSLEGDFNLVDMESQAQMQTFVSDYMREKYTENLHEHQAKIQELCDRAKAEFYTTSSDKDIFDSIYGIIMEE